MLNPDYKDMLVALSAESVEFLVIGAFAVAVHGAPRSTGDFDVFVRNSAENADRVWRALLRFGAPLAGMSPADFESPDLIYQIGVAPCRVDVVTSISGIEFEEAWTHRVTVELEGQSIPVIGLAELISNKRASGRPKDLEDLRSLDIATARLRERSQPAAPVAHGERLQRKDPSGRPR